MASKKKKDEGEGTRVELSEIAPEMQGTGILATHNLRGVGQATPTPGGKPDDPIDEFATTILQGALLPMLKMQVNRPPTGIISTALWLDFDLERNFTDKELHLAYVVASRIAENSVLALKKLLMNDEFKRLLSNDQRKKWAKEKAAKQQADYTAPVDSVLSRAPDMSAIDVAKKLVEEGILEHCPDGFRYVGLPRTIKLSSLAAKVSRQRKVLRSLSRKN